MSSQESPVPKFRRHATGQAFVQLNGRRIYLGRFDRPESREKYHRLIAEWLSNGRCLPHDDDDLTIIELVEQYWQHLLGYYVRPDGSRTSEPGAIRLALRPVRELYGRTPAADFGPRALRAVRHAMIEAGWRRKSINTQISRVKRMFRWAAEHELLPGSVWHALSAVGGLRRGRSAAKESEPVRPVSAAHIEGIRIAVSAQVWAMIEVQRLSGMRAGEVTIMRPADIDRTGDVWLYRPSDHKTAHHGHERVVCLGPKAQNVLKPFLFRAADAYCFSPAEAEADRRRRIHAERRTPLSCGNRPGTNRRKRPRKQPGERYTTQSYGRAIAEGCRKSGVPHWTSHQLRHTAATDLRRAFGLDAARVVLGHRSPAVTDIYAEIDLAKAVDAMLKMG